MRVCQSATHFQFHPHLIGGSVFDFFLEQDGSARPALLKLHICLTFPPSYSRYFRVVEATSYTRAESKEERRERHSYTKEKGRTDGFGLGHGIRK